MVCLGDLRVNTLYKGDKDDDDDDDNNNNNNNPLFLSDFKETLIFSTDFRKIPECQITAKSAQWETSCSLTTDGRTDLRTDRHDEADSRFPQFLQTRLKHTNAPCGGECRILAR